MKPEHSNKVAKKIESVCEQGCSEVNQLLKKAENGEKIEELSEFSNKEINQIIDELSDIMTVYDIDNDAEDCVK